MKTHFTLTVLQDSEISNNRDNTIKRIKLLETLIENFDDGRSKSF